MLLAVNNSMRIPNDVISISSFDANLNGHLNKMTCVYSPLGLFRHLLWKCDERNGTQSKLNNRTKL